MRDLIDELAALRPRERARLERFATAFERIDARMYSRLGQAPDGTDVAPAENEALELVGTGRRRDAVKAAVQAFVGQASANYSWHSPRITYIGPIQGLPDRAEDRVRFRAALERAVVAVILWDDLSEESRVTLLGPWALTVIPLIESDAS